MMAITTSNSTRVKPDRHRRRSEILDIKTCAVCVNLDSMVVAVGSPDFNEFMPPAKCLGQDRCRGFYVPVSEEIAA